jgi:hypothetical protein
MKLKKDITIYDIAQKLDLSSATDLIIRNSSLRKKTNDYA